MIETTDSFTLLVINFVAVEVLVLDEADRLLDMGFRQQLDAIMARLPRQRRTGLFSATQTEAVEALARAGLRNPVRVAVAVSYAPNSGAGEASADTRKKAGKKTKDGDANGSKAEAGVKAPGYEQVTPSTLSVQYTAVDVAGKVAQLASFLAAHVHEKVIVYFLTCACVDYFATVLPRLAPCKAVPFRALHGRMKQSVREAALEAFASAHAGVLLCTDVAARGLDIPDVHWVVQYDAPQDPSAFVHRCGRTARMGRSGSALAYLTPEEVPYVDFLRLRKVPLEEVPPVPDLIPDVLRVLRSESESDRAVMESGTKAFVSYIRAYKEHHCKYIFRMESLRVGQLASSFALLRLPRMQELKKAAREAASGKLEGFAPSLVDPETVKFRDKAKEKQRQAVLKQRAAAVAAAAVEAGEAANGAHAAAATAAAQQRKQRQGAQEQPRLTANKRRQLEARQELAELNEEYTLLKKLKKGKISAREYDAATGASSDDEGPGPRGQGAKDGAGVKDRGHGAGQAPGEGLLGVNLVAAALKKKSRKAKKKKSRAMKREAGLGGATEG